jgi:hypothetical protein
MAATCLIQLATGSEDLTLNMDKLEILLDPRYADKKVCPSHLLCSAKLVCLYRFASSTSPVISAQASHSSYLSVCAF